MITKDTKQNIKKSSNRNGRSDSAELVLDGDFQKLTIVR